MSYRAAFGFLDSPFLDAPDQRFLFLAKQHENLLAELVEFVAARQGVAVVSGDDGVGKTMLIQTLIQRLPQSFQPLILTRPAPQPLAITLLIAQSLGLNLGERTLVNLTSLADALQAAAQQQKYFLVILDDAHDLTDQNLEEVYILSQMEYHGQQLMPILLVGRKGLVQKVASKANQRIKEIVRKNLTLAGLNFEETILYIDHRLQQVGSSFKACFADGCSGQIFSRTGGIPRRINQVCDQALTRAWQENRSRVTRDLLGEEESTTHYKPLEPPAKGGLLRSYGPLAGLLLLAGLTSYALYHNYYRPVPQTPLPVVESPTPPGTPPPALSLQQPTPEPLKVSQAPTRRQTAEKDTGHQEPDPAVPQDSPGPKPAVELKAAESSPAPPPEKQIPEPEDSRPATYEVSPDDGLLRIVASHYPDEKDLGYDAVILGNPQISNENVIFSGQKLSLPKVDKSNKVIKLNNNEYFGIFGHYYSSSQVEKTVARLKELQLRYLIRETKIAGEGTVYRIFLGGYASKEELQKALLLAKHN